MIGLFMSEMLAIKPSSSSLTGSRRRSLRKLSPDLISKAIDETAAQVTRTGLTFLGTAAFCRLSLLSPDSALLGGSEKINVPLAAPVSFFGFMLLGPTILIALRVYFQIYVEHSDRLDRLARSVSVVRAPTLVPLKNSLIRPELDCRSRRALLHLSYSCAPPYSDGARDTRPHAEVRPSRARRPDRKLLRCAIR